MGRKIVLGVVLGVLAAARRSRERRARLRHTSSWATWCSTRRAGSSRMPCPSSRTPRSPRTVAANSPPSPANSRRSWTTSSSNSTNTARSTRPASRSARRANSLPPTCRPPAAPAATRSSARASATPSSTFPEQGPIKVGSPITLFNGPKKGGDDTIIAHAHLDYPGPATFIVPIVIEKIHNGVFGYRVNVKIPKIAGGYGHPISGSAKVGKKWTFKGKKHSYINARCETGHFQVKGQFTFKDADRNHSSPPTSSCPAKSVNRGAPSAPCRDSARVRS